MPEHPNPVAHAARFWRKASERLKLSDLTEKQILDIEHYLDEIVPCPTVEQMAELENRRQQVLGEIRGRL